ncbi:General secretion pathway protein D [hydrothermal vent metagenome]|uniref:General secretion pathway protein D n=1 Tax=hydrothermal vent metagenome TaxID=652676 RepID=A0A3B1AHZ2_9ZZZZ
MINHGKQLGKTLALTFMILFSLSINPVSAADQLTLNFTDTDINAVIGAVSEMTGQNFIVDPRVKGKVTIISNKAMNADDVYQVFLSILKVHGFAAISGKHVTKIVPEVNAKQDAVPTLTRRRKNAGDEFVTQVVEVKHVNAAQLVPILRPLVPQRGHLAAYPSSNILVISDSAANINRLMTIIHRIDQATSDELEIIELKYASASEIVRVINQLTRQVAKGAASSGAKLKIVADDRTNSILLGGDKSRRIKLRSIIAHLDTEVDIGGATHVVYLHYANAKDLVKVLTSVGKNIQKKSKGGAKAGSSRSAANNTISIQADETTNALVINAPPDVFRTLRTVIQKLDIRRAQILIEGLIAEVSVNSVESFGVSWGAAKINDAGALANDAPVGVVNFNNSIESLLSTPPTIGSGLSILAGNLTGATKIGALINAFASDSGTNIISTPSILTMDNEESEIVVAQQVPFTTGSFSSTGTGGTTNPGNPFQTIERQDVGLTLRITPQVNEGDTIKLDVVQELSQLLGSAIGTQPITTKRSIKTSIMVEDGQMIALGGLIEEKLVEKEDKVPLLGDIPVLGWLFKSQSTSTEKTNFMLFLSPKILKDAAMQTSVTGEKYNYIRARQLDIRERGVVLMSDDVSPLLPEFKEFLKLPKPFDEDGQSETNNTSDETSSVDDNLDDSASTVTPPDLEDVALDERDKLLYQQEIISKKNKQSILNGDVF